MVCEAIYKIWNKLFISLTIRIGEIYFKSGNLNKTLEKVREEKRWAWVDEDFIKAALKLYLYAQEDRRRLEGIESHSMEDIFSHVLGESPDPIPSSTTVKGRLLSLYMGE